MEPSLQAAELFLKRKSKVLVLTGAQAVYDSGTPFARAYGMCKAAVHHLALSVAKDESVTPDRRVACILPSILDTPRNRQEMLNADSRKWTPLDSVAKTVLALCNGEDVKGYDPANVFLRV